MAIRELTKSTEDIRVELMTPSMAADLLKLNISNRPLRIKTAQLYASDMKAGDWSLSNDLITVTESGKLANGQHRLNAVVLSGMTVPMMVWRGAPNNVYDTIDQGLKRSAGTKLLQHGYKNCNRLGSLLGVIDRYESGNTVIRGSVISHSHVLSLAETYPEAQECYVMTQFGPVNTMGCDLFIYVASKRWGIKPVREFVQAVAAGEGFKGDPAYTVHHHLARIKQRNGNVGVPMNTVFWSMWRGWMAHIKGESLSLIRNYEGTITKSAVKDNLASGFQVTE